MLCSAADLVRSQELRRNRVSRGYVFDSEPLAGWLT
jgi:hypothetical protein